MLSATGQKGSCLATPLGPFGLSGLPHSPGEEDINIVKHARKPGWPLARSIGSRWRSGLLLARFFLLLLVPIVVVAQTSVGEDDSVYPVAENAAEVPPLNDNRIILVEKPVWEAGFGVASFRGFDYPASNDANNVSIALPFFIFRDEIVRVAGRGVGAVAYETPRVKFDLSVGGSLNAESSGNSTRAGLPDLDFLFELGPRLNVLLSNQSYSSGSRSTWRWLSGARAAFSTDFGSVDGRGFILSTELELNVRNVFGSKFDFRYNIGAEWATRRLHEFFYSVPTEFTTPTRSAFSADSGYLGSEVSLGFGYRLTPAIRIFASATYENFNGAANSDSPLFETDESTTFAIAVVWTLKSSKRTIAVFEEN